MVTIERRSAEQGSGEIMVAGRGRKTAPPNGPPASGFRFTRSFRLAQFPLEFGDASQQFGQLLQGDHLAFGLPVGLGRVAKPFLPIFDVVHDARLRGD